MSLVSVNFAGKAIDYLNGTPLKGNQASIASDVSSAASGAPLMAGFDVLGHINKYTRDIKTVSDVAQFSGTAEEFAAQTANKGGFFKFLRHPFKTLNAMFKGTGAYISDAKNIIGKGSLNTNNYDLFHAIKRIDNAAVNNGAKLSKEALEELTKQKSALENLIKSGATKETAGKAISGADELISKTVTTTSKKGLFKKIGSALATPFKAIGTKIAESGPTGAKIMEKLGKVGKVAKGSGAGIMAVFEGVSELLTEVIPAFKNGGAESGVKQVGKSAVKVGASIGGYVAGAAAGAKLGAIVGSAFPGVGTIIGGALGFAGGLIGSALFSGVAKKITGKSENQKIQEQQEQQQAVAIANDDATANELKTAVAAKVQQDYMTGNVTEDTKEMEQELQTLSQTTTTQPSFGSLTTPQNNTATSVPYPIATNADGSYDFSVPAAAQISTASTTNPYGYIDPLLA